MCILASLSSHFWFGYYHFIPTILESTYVFRFRCPREVMSLIRALPVRLMELTCREVVLTVGHVGLRY